MENLELEKVISPVIKSAGALEICDVAGLQQGNQMCQTIKSLIQEVETTFGPIKEKAHDTWKEVVAQEKRFLLPLQAADKKIRGKIGTYMLSVKQQREEQERLDRLAEEAKKTWEEQKDRIEDDVSSFKISEEDATEKLKELEVVKNSATPQLQNLASTMIPQVEGMRHWTEKIGEVVDKAALLKAVVEGGISLDLVDINLKVLQRLVRSGMDLPGVKVSERSIVSIKKNNVSSQ